jgi:hypothetical protein
MEKMTLKSYAVRHKLSLFNVVKMVKSGQLQSEVIEENGKETTYILFDPDTTPPKEAKSQREPVPSSKELYTLVRSLQEEVTRLRQEMEHLKITIGRKG